MRIIGIDPGSRLTGYGIISFEKGKEKLVEYGVIRLDSKKSHEYRLKQIYDRLIAVIDRTLPDYCAVEMPVYGKNPQSMLKLGRAQAACMLASMNRDVPVVQYTPKEIKLAVTGNGNASKEQVWFMVRSILAIREHDDNYTLDATDALAIAICHAHRNAQKGPPSHSSGWSQFIKDNPDRVK